MKIETYEIEEIKGEAGIMAADHEAMELVEKLGLAGQKELANPETVTRFPYRKMTKIEDLVYGIHCPNKTPVEEYNSGIIPLRVLQVIAHVRETGFCKQIRIWHPEEVRLDPVLVGYTKDAYNGEVFLLARWGEVWKDFEQLKTEALDIWKKKVKSKLVAARGEVDAAINNIEEIAEETFATGRDKSVNFYFH